MRNTHYTKLLARRLLGLSAQWFSAHCRKTSMPRVDRPAPVHSEGDATWLQGVDYLVDSEAD